MMYSLIQKKRWAFEDYSEFITYIILISIFFIRISFGASEAYSSENSISLPFYNFEAVIILLVFLGYINNLGVSKVKIFKILIIACPFLIIQFFYFIAYHLEPITGETINYFYRFARAFFFILCVLIYSVVFFDEKIFFEAFYKFLNFVAWVSLFAYISNLLFNTTYLLHYQIGSDYYRIQGFFSEPSACSAFFSAYFFISVYKKRKVNILVSLLVIYFAKSPTTFLTFAISLFIFLLLLRKYRFIAVGISSILLLVLITVFINFDLTEFGQTLFSSDSSTISSVGRLLVGLDDVKSGGANGANSRLQGTQALLDDMDKYNLFWTGYGFNASSEFFLSKYGDVRDYSLFYSMLFSYGIIGVLLFYLTLLITLINMYKKSFSFLLLYIPFVVSTSINSAQGFVIYQIVFLGIFTFFVFNTKYKI